MREGAVLYIVLPCYNEEEVLPETSARLREKMQSLIQTGAVSADSRIVFVDDGSKDRTWKMIEELHNEERLFSGVKLSRNRGHQNALFAGLMTVKDSCDITISMDADLQDDVGVIDLFLKKHSEGCDVVYGVRKDRSSDTTVKRGTAVLFYRIMTRMGVESVFNHADCRLMSKRALDAFSEFGEVNLFLRGMVPLVGFRSECVEYTRSPRFAGVSKYPFKKMLQLALNGITSFSAAPIRLIAVFGFIVSTLSLVSALVLTVFALFGRAIPLTGWLLVSLWLVCGMLLAATGVVGEYVGKAYEEIKARPRYFIETFLNSMNPEK